MNILDIIFISIGLSMDACAVGICKGLSMKKFSIKKGIVIGVYFGLFQGLMPLLGYFLGTTFESVITNVDHWTAFILLSFIGINMIKESFSESNSLNDLVSFREMFPLSIATSIDALAVGITCAFLKVNIISMIIMIGVITFIMSFIGSYIGNKFGCRFERKAQVFGGIILISLGLKILIDHLFF